MKLKYSFEPVSMGDDVIAVPVGENADQVQGILRLNKEGQEILTMLEQDTTEETIVDALAQKYENDRETLARYVRNMIGILREDGLIED